MGGLHARVLLENPWLIIGLWDFLERNTVEKILWKISEIKCLGCKIAKKPGFNSYICQKPSAKTLHSFRKQENRKLLPSEICNCNKVIVYSFLFKSLWIISNWVRRSRKAEKVNNAFCLHLRRPVLASPDHKVNNAFCLHLRRPVLAIPDHCCDFFPLIENKTQKPKFLPDRCEGQYGK